LILLSRDTLEGLVDTLLEWLVFEEEEAEPQSRKSLSKVSSNIARKMLRRRKAEAPIRERA